MNHNKHKYTIGNLLIVALLLFVSCGCIARFLTQITGAIWLDNIVTIIGGSASFLLGACIIYSMFKAPSVLPRWVVCSLGALISAPFLVLGLMAISIGASRLLTFLPW